MNANTFTKMAYENKSNWTLGQNKPNSNPIKPNFQKAQMNVNLTLTKDYRKNDDFVVRINKPNSNPIPEKPKMNVNVFATKDYENVTTSRPIKQTQTNPISIKKCQKCPALIVLYTSNTLPAASTKWLAMLGTFNYCFEKVEAPVKPGLNIGLASR